MFIGLVTFFAAAALGMEAPCSNVTGPVIYAGSFRLQQNLKIRIGLRSAAILSADGRCHAVCRVRGKHQEPGSRAAIDLTCKSTELSSLETRALVRLDEVPTARADEIRFGSWIQGYQKTRLLAD